HESACGGFCGTTLRNPLFSLQFFSFSSVVLVKPKNGILHALLSRVNVTLLDAFCGLAPRKNLLEQLRPQRWTFSSASLRLTYSVQSTALLRAKPFAEYPERESKQSP